MCGGGWGLDKLPPCFLGRTGGWISVFLNTVATVGHSLGGVGGVVCEINRYLEAWERRHDYDLYCVLAGQFWPLEAEAFRKCTRPGKKLFLEIEAPARVIARMWKTCWPFRKVTPTRARRICCFSGFRLFTAAARDTAINAALYSS